MDIRICREHGIVVVAMGGALLLTALLLVSLLR